MSNVILFNPSDNAFVTFDWGDTLPAGVTLNGAPTYTAPAPLTITAGPVSGNLSQAKLTGGLHGAIYQIAGVALLSNTESMTRVFPVRFINS